MSLRVRATRIGSSRSSSHCDCKPLVQVLVQSDEEESKKTKGGNHASR
jgi:hypothetical protein